MVPQTIAPESVTVERTRSREALAYAGRRVLWDQSSLDRVRRCGKHSVKDSGSVAVRVTTRDGNRVAGFAGLASCGSIWACPVCSRKIAGHRQQEIEHAVDWWESIGGATAMATFTVAHYEGQSLKTVWDAVQDGWKSVTTGRAWKRNMTAFGIEGWTRVIEVTHGRNGWHVHVHVLLYLHHGLGRLDRSVLSAAMLGRWRTGIGKHGFSASEQVGADVRMMHGKDAAKLLADYFTKGSYQPSGDAGRQAGLEVARGDLKRGRPGGGRTPFQILEAFFTTGDCDELALWHEWEKGSRGRRQMTWSKGFRALAGLLTEKTDDEIAAEEIGTNADDVFVLPKKSWAIVRYAAEDLKHLIERSGVRAGKAWLDAAGIEWHDPGQRPTG